MDCTGWVKRGATGVIGSNRVCPAETVELLFADYQAERLEDLSKLSERVEEFVVSCQPEVVQY